MSTQVAELAVKMSANASALQTGLGKAAADIKGFADKSTKYLAGVMGGGGIFATLLGGGAFGQMMQAKMGEIASLGKEARKVGMGSEAFAGLKALAGGDSDSMVIGLKHLQKELGQVGLDSGATEAKFAALGLSAKELSEVPLEKAFGQISDRMASMTSESQKAALATALFGKSGQELIPILEKGNDALAKRLKYLQDLGVVPSGLDIDTAKNAKTAMMDNSLVMQGAQNKIAIQGAPLIGGAAGGLSKVVEFLNSAQKGVALWTAGIDGLVHGELDGIGKFQDRIRAQQNAELAEKRAEDSKALFNKELDRKAKAMFAAGKTDVAKEMPNLLIKGGKNAGQLDNVGKALQDRLGQLRAPGLEEGHKYFDATFKALEEQADRLRMSSRELERFRDITAGASVAQRAMLDMMRDSLKVAGIKEDNKSNKERYDEEKKELDRLHDQHNAAAAIGHDFDRKGGVGGEIDKAKEGAKGFFGEGAGRGLNALFGGLLGGIVDVGLGKAKEGAAGLLGNIGHVAAAGIGLDDAEYKKAMARLNGKYNLAAGPMPGVGALMEGSQAGLSAFAQFARRQENIAANEKQERTAKAVEALAGLQPVAIAALNGILAGVQRIVPVRIARLP